MTRSRVVAAVFGVLLVAAVVVGLWWVPATFGPLWVDCGGIPRGACDEHWRFAAANEVAQGHVPASVPVLGVRIDGFVGSEGYCPSLTWMIWSNAHRLEFESFC